MAPARGPNRSARSCSPPSPRCCGRRPRNGTPAGVGAVGHGDEIVAEVTGVGRLGVTVDATGAVPCPTSGAGAGPVPPPVPTPVRGR